MLREGYKRSWNKLEQELAEMVWENLTNLAKNNAC
jgi:hypothetical protein